MPLSESEELELLELENEEAGAMRDAPADTPDTDYLGMAMKLFNPLAAAAGIKDDVLGAERALLTNDPTQSFGESVLRGVPAGIGGAVGGTIGAVAGAPTLTSVATGVGGAMLGGAAVESGRQAVAQTYSGITGRGQVQRPGSVIRDIAIQGALQGPGHIINQGSGLLAKYYGNRLPATLQSFFQVPEQMTKYTQKRGADAVFASENLVEGAPLENVGKATTDLAARRSAVGSQIGRAEDAVLNKIGVKAPALRHIREGLDDALYARGITDPKTAGLARSKEAGLLQRLKEVLTPREGGAMKTSPDGITQIPITEKLTLRQALNTKRLIDENLEFAEKELSTSTEQLLKRVNHQIRESVRSDMGPEVSKLWDDFGTIADAQEKLAEFTGTRALSNVEQRAVQALRGIMNKNPGEVENIVKILGEGLPGGEAQARQIFDSIAGAAFTKDSVGAPSNILLKGATAGGLLSAPVARGAVRFGEYLAKPAAIPAGVYGPGLTPLADAYLKRNVGSTPDPTWAALGGQRPVYP